MPGAALAGLRIGPVSYLNTKPLIWSLDPAVLQPDVPAKLSEKFRAGALDAALLPVFEVLHMGGGDVVDDVAIACRGEVYSVMVASRADFADITRIHLDPSSRTSSSLLRVLLAEWYPGTATVVSGEPILENDARLLIGDPAIRFRQEQTEGWQFHDLGLLWQKHTGLPFVFAVWLVSPGAPQEVFEALRAAKKSGLAALEEICGREKDPAFAHLYLEKHIRFDLGDEQKQAIRLFESLARRHGLLPGSEPVPLNFR